MSSLSDLTIIIVTYRTDEKILTDCINSIENNIKIKIIENSSEFNLKENIQISQFIVQEKILAWVVEIILD